MSAFPTAPAFVRQPQPARRLALAAVLALACGGVEATTTFDEQMLRNFVSERVGATQPQATRFDVHVGQLRAGTVLEPCRRVEPFLPAHGRLWGRSSVGVRCVDGATWTVMLPVTVTAWGMALVAVNPLPSGSVLTANDVQEQEVELTRQAPGLATDLALLEGRTLNRTVQAGQPLRTDMVRATPVVKSGDPVRLRIQGAGFTIQAAGQALAHAAEGQTLRVRTEMGKIVNGIAREGRIVDVAL